MNASPSPEHLVSRLRFRHLRLLTTLQQGGSLRAAAQALNLTQPALSKTLADVEAAFGFALFARSARGLTPTPEGDIAIRGAHLLLRQLEHLRREAAAAQHYAASLRLGAPPFVAQGYLPGVLKKLSERTPQVRVQLFEERVPALMQALLKGDVDALLTSYPAEMPEHADTLRYEKLFDVSFIVIAPRNHRLAGARKVSWQELSQQAWVLPAQGAMARRLIDDCFMRSGAVPPTPLIESASPVTNIELVSAGIGLGVAPEMTFAAYAKNLKRVVALRLDAPVPSGPVALIHRADADAYRIDLLRQAMDLAPRD